MLICEAFLIYNVQNRWNMDNKKLLGKRIKELRKHLGLTQEKLAEMISIETTSLSGIESGRHFSSLPTVEKIARNLKVEMKVLFDFSHLQPVDKMKDDIINNIDKLEDEKIAFIYRFFEDLK